MNTELTIHQIEQALANLPTLIEKAGQELITAENLLSMAQAQRDIEQAKIRIAHIEEEISAKILESFAIIGTEVLTKEIIELDKIVEIKKLAKNLLENKYISARKIGTLRNIYQPM